MGAGPSAWQRASASGRRREQARSADRALTSARPSCYGVQVAAAPQFESTLQSDKERPARVGLSGAWIRRAVASKIWQRRTNLEGCLGGKGAGFARRALCQTRSHAAPMLGCQRAVAAYPQASGAGLGMIDRIFACVPNPGTDHKVTPLGVLLALVHPPASEHRQEVKKGKPECRRPPPSPSLEAVQGRRARRGHSNRPPRCWRPARARGQRAGCRCTGAMWRRWRPARHRCGER